MPRVSGANNQLVSDDGNRLVGYRNPNGGDVLYSEFSQRNYKLAICGDSLNANFYGAGNGGGAGISSQQYKSIGPVTWAMILSNQMMDIVYDGSTGATQLDPAGTTSPNIPTQIARAIARRPHEIFVNGGTNDLNSSATLDQLKFRILSIIRSVSDAGIPVLRIADIPSIQGVAYTVARQATTFAYNAWLLTLPAIFPFVRILQWSKTVVDPTSSTAAWISGRQDVDNTHWTNVGAYYAGKLLASQWVAEYLTIDRLVTSDVDSRAYSSATNKLLGTPMWLTGATTPTGWTNTQGATAALTSALSKAARPDGFGNNVVLPIQFNDGATTASSALNGPDLKGNLNMGEQIRFLIGVDVSANAAAAVTTLTLKCLRVNLALTMANTAYNQTMSALPLLTADTSIPEAFTGVIATPWMDTSLSLPGGAVSSLLPEIKAFGAAQGGAIVKVGRPTIEVRL